MADTLSEIRPEPAVTGSESPVGRIMQATALVTALTFVVKGLGFVEKLLLAFFFGTGPEVDAYLVAYSIPFSAYIVLREVVKPAFLPTFLQNRREAEGRDWRLFGSLGGGAFLLAAHLLGVQEPAIAWRRARAWWKARHRPAGSDQ